MRFIRPFREILFLATVDTSVAELDKLEKLFRESVIFRKGYYFSTPQREKCATRQSNFQRAENRFTRSCVNTDSFVSNPFVTIKIIPLL